MHRLRCNRQLRQNQQMQCICQLLLTVESAMLVGGVLIWKSPEGTVGRWVFPGSCTQWGPLLHPGYCPCVAPLVHCPRSQASPRTPMTDLQGDSSAAGLGEVRQEWEEISKGVLTRGYLCGGQMSHPPMPPGAVGQSYPTQGPRHHDLRHPAQPHSLRAPGKAMAHDLQAAAS